MIAYVLDILPIAVVCVLLGMWVASFFPPTK